MIEPLTRREEVWMRACESSLKSGGSSVTATSTANNCLKAFDEKFKPEMVNPDITLNCPKCNHGRVVATGESTVSFEEEGETLFVYKCDMCQEQILRAK